MTTLQAVLFEIQLLKSKESEPELLHSDSQSSLRPSNYDEIEEAGGPEFTRDDTFSDVATTIADRRGSQGLRSILLKGEMRYLKDVNMLIFLCSPL